MADEHAHLHHVTMAHGIKLMFFAEFIELRRGVDLIIHITVHGGVSGCMKSQ